MAVSYTGVVTVTGEGRNGGQVVADDGNLTTALAIPKEFGGSGGATNPEQLFAAGWGACFLGAVRRAAGERKVRLTSTAVRVETTLTHGDDGEFGLGAVLNLELGGVDQATAVELAAAAHRLCPYSKATRGNIPVTVNATAVAG
ncbi:Ohr family peroxiredoxin [Streptomyces sp. SP17BM10]|uniref:Ohr family peroxiredoxin n=1 Tax=Streptomyces sp. SP17BM10 TaxID=3002530 RepID=UPI002E76CAA8|nr:Ohr family peroxiredoxin [Streptomyces sp. SP17BM10]MEE1783621.1 Ohr family peroxiredoxin [Streptomyces sp. SP17BM10]